MQGPHTDQFSYDQAYSCDYLSGLKFWSEKTHDRMTSFYPNMNF